MKIKSTFFFHGITACCSILCLASCGDIQQDLYLKADGSGKLEASFELGEMMAMMKGFDDVDISDVTIEEGVTPDTIQQEPAINKDPMQAIFDRVTDPAYPHDFDTLISMYTMMPDSAKAKEKKPELVKPVSIRIQSPANSDDLTVGLVIDFKDTKHLQDIINHLDTIDGNAMTMPAGGGGGFPTETFLMFDADMKNGVLRFDSMDYGGVTAEMGIGMPGDSLMGSEDMGMMEMMFGNSKIRSIIHVPGEVLSCSNKDAILTKDNRVIIEHKFMDVMTTGKIPGYEIRFTPRK